MLVMSLVLMSLMERLLYRLLIMELRWMPSETRVSSGCGKGTYLIMSGNIRRKRRKGTVRRSECRRGTVSIVASPIGGLGVVYSRDSASSMQSSRIGCTRRGQLSYAYSSFETCGSTVRYWLSSTRRPFSLVSRNSTNSYFWTR